MARPTTRRPRISLPLTPAPPTPWNKAITSHRRFAMRSTSLDNIKALKDATGCTVNDIVMAICAGALREYLIKHDALPDKPLRAMVPVSIRTGDEEDPWTNRVSSIIAELPTNCADPLERVQRCHEAMNAAKRQMDLVPATALTDITQFTSPVVATSAMRLDLASRSSPTGSTCRPTSTISNVPGPRQPLYFAGARMDNYIPVSTIADGMGLNITVHSYLDQLDFGLIADRELVPDLWDMVDMHIDEIARLFEATGAEWVEPQLGPSMRRGGNSREARPAPRRDRREEDRGQEDAAKKPPAKKTAAKKTPAKKPPRRRPPAKKTRQPKKTAPPRRSPRSTTHDGRDHDERYGPVTHRRHRRRSGRWERVRRRGSGGETDRRWISTCLPTTTRIDAPCAPWLAEHPDASPQELAEAGYVVPHWPAPWGLDADPIHQLIIDDELTKANVRRPSNPIGIGWAAPTIFLAGTPGAARPLPAEDLQRRGGLVPAVLGARRRLRPRQPFLSGGQGRRRVRRQRLEDLVERRAPRAARHPDRPHRPRSAEAQGHLVLHLPDGPARASR